MHRREFLEAGLASAALTLVWRSRGPGGSLRAFVGTYTDSAGSDTGSAGVYRLRSTDVRRIPLARDGARAVGPNPSFVALHPRLPVLYAVNETDAGAVAAFRYDPLDGELTPLGRQPTGGGAPCYASVDPGGRFLFVANYVGGSVARFPLDAHGAPGAPTLHQHQGTGPRADRQERAHAHSIVPDPSGRWALSADLGADRIYVYPVAGPFAPASELATAPGAGPRHIAFDASGRFVYVVNELALTAAVYRFDAAAGTLAPVQTVPLVDGPGPGGERTAADVHLAPSGRFLYASVRGDDVLVVFSVDPSTGMLALVERVSTGGHWPRNFGIAPSGRLLVVANQRSNTLVAFAVDPETGRLTPDGLRLDVPAPVCVRFVG